MENWFDIILPHNDIIDGHLDESYFAAKLEDVVDKTAAIDYSDPSMFFQKTYLTEGLKDLLIVVNNKLQTGKGNGIIQIQTPFGGGKTHTLVAIYHLIKNWDDIKNEIEFIEDGVKASAAVIVGTQLNPVKGRKIENIHIKTIWGEIAYQIGGLEGYKEFSENDQQCVPPGKADLKKFFEKHQPFVILMDEMVQYITKAAGVKVEKETLASQTLAFFLELTGAISSCSNGMVIATLPSSALEDVSEANEEYLLKISKIFGREEKIVTPVQGEEIYSVIRKRLFDKIQNEKKMKKVINGYFEFYQDKKSELPEKVRDINYKSKLEKSYPFHPEIIDTLYEKWGTFSTLQRTRGILRLLALIIFDLYKKEKNIDIILPADIDFGNSEIRREFIKHIGNEYDSIISSDINNKSRLMDRQNKTYKHLTEHITTSIFFNSFCAGSYEKGIQLPYIKLSTLRQESVSTLVTEILKILEEKLWYLNVKNATYYFSNIPNLNRMILDKKELHNSDCEEKLKDILKSCCGTDIKTFLWIDSSNDIGDTQELKLVLLSPDFEINKIKEFVDKKGQSFRAYKNTFIFAVLNLGNYISFKEQVKTYLALNDIKDEIKSGSNKLLLDRIDEISNRIKTIEKDFAFNCKKIYNKIIVNEKEYLLGEPVIGKDSLSTWIKQELIEREVIQNNLHYRFIMKNYLDNIDKIRTKDLLDNFYKNEKRFIIASKEVLSNALAKGVTESAFGLCFIKDDKIEDLKFGSFTDISYQDDEYIITAELAKKYLENKKSKDADADIPIDIDKPTDEESEFVLKSQEPQSIDDKVKKRKVNKLYLKIKDIPATKLFDFSRGVILPISSEIGDFNFNVTIDISTDNGISQSVIETKIKETINQIGAKIEAEKIE